MAKITYLAIAISLMLGATACSSTTNDSRAKEEVAKETSNQDQKKEIEYLVSKYLELEKGLSYENIESKLSKDKIKVNDSGEFDAPAGYKKREVSFIDGDNKLDLVFRDNKLASKTFNYDKLYNTDEKSEAHGIWKNSITQIECTDEYDMIIKVQDEL